MPGLTQVRLISTQSKAVECCCGVVTQPISTMSMCNVYVVQLSIPATVNPAMRHLVVSVVCRYVWK